MHSSKQSFENCELTHPLSFNCKWEYLEEPTYQHSFGSMVCITCSKFTFKSDINLGSLLFCKSHNGLIFDGEHLTHSCESYKKN